MKVQLNLSAMERRTVSASGEPAGKWLFGSTQTTICLALLGRLVVSVMVSHAYQAYEQVREGLNVHAVADSYK